jgi:hypothetical protein
VIRRWLIPLFHSEAERGKAKDRRLKTEGKEGLKVKKRFTVQGSRFMGWEEQAGIGRLNQPQTDADLRRQGVFQLSRFSPDFPAVTFSTIADKFFHGLPNVL